MSRDSKQTDPLQNLYSDIKKILSFTEFKDLKKANANEISSESGNVEMWMNLKLGRDSYLTYTKYWDIAMFQEVLPTIKWNNYQYFLANPYNVPLDFRDNLLTRGRERFLAEYEEKNNYYRTLYGLPPYGTNKSDYIYLSSKVRNQLHASELPVHELSTLIQNNYINTDEYKQVLADNPDKEYLKYLGMYKIDPFTARNAKDFDIIRYPLDRNDINENLLNRFAAIYADCREYIMVAIYNSQLEDIYTGYRDFMKFLILMYTFLQVNNAAVESIHNKKFFDDSILHIYLSIFGIPDNLSLTNDVRRDLAINMCKLIKEKGTNEVYYDLINLLGYQDVSVSKLMLVKGQQFDSDNNYMALSEDDSNFTSVSDIENKNIKTDPYFIKVDLTDDDPYNTIVNCDAPTYSYHDIVDSDPTWWDLSDTREILSANNYSIADSKYIMIESTIHQMEYITEAIYFMRMVLDNKESTDDFYMQLPELLGTSTVSIYDALVFILCAMCMSNNLKGTIINDEENLYAVAGFNFNMDYDSFEEYLNSTEYVDKERVIEFLNNLTMTDESDINRLFNDVIIPMREWLEHKIESTTIREEYIEYENIYRALYTYDINYNTFYDDFEMPLEIIEKDNDISEEDMEAYKYFYPHKLAGGHVTVDDYSTSSYKYPFLERNYKPTWYIHIVIETPQGEDDRGYLYFYDVLNCDDVKLLTNDDGTRIFMDYNDSDVGWVVNQKAVNRALYLIDQLDETELSKAYFQIDTPIPNSGGKHYDMGTKLPASIRNGTYKNVLKSKIEMDINGLCDKPTTYLEYLYRKNESLYNILMEDDRFNTNKDAWLDDVLKVVLAVETELDLHMKYFEQSVVGTSLFFKPLITLIKYFKSTFVNFAKTEFNYIFDDKMDAGGNCNMIKLFDEVLFKIHFVTLGNTGYESQLGFYDAIHKMTKHILMKDRSTLMNKSINIFEESGKPIRMGSVGLVDEVKFYKNGTELDPDGSKAYWIHGEDNSYTYLMNNRDSKETVQNVDLEGWKDYVVSYNP